MESIDKRKDTIIEWLRTDCGLHGVSLQTLPSDASFRRYYRIYSSEGSFIVMDAPPERENCLPYIAIAKALRTRGLQTPEIIRTDLTLGLLLISDFGDLTYLKILNMQNADQLYHSAMKTLSVLQACHDIDGYTMPFFTHDLMWQEWLWCKEWFLDNLLSLYYKEKELDDCIAFVVDQAANQNQVFMHRDYHSGNLMLLPRDNVGILDFQDAFIGPITYDLVSLLKDCYIDWPDASVNSWVNAYWCLLKDKKLIDVDQDTFLCWFDWMGIQRHLKALFTFARKHIRDSQSQYLDHVPRTLNYLLKTSSQYPILSTLHVYLREDVYPAFQQVKEALCVQ